MMMSVTKMVKKMKLENEEKAEIVMLLVFDENDFKEEDKKKTSF